MNKFKWDLLHVSVAMFKMRKKLFGHSLNSGGLRFNVSFVDRESMFVESVLRRRLVSPGYL